MFYALSKIVDVLLGPLTWAFVLLLAALARWRAPQGRWLAFTAVAVLYVFSIEPVSNRLVRHVELSTPRQPRADVTYDAVILLGGLLDHGATRSSGQPSYNDNVERLLTTFDLLRTGRAKNAILSGGPAGPSDPVVEARVLGAQLEAWGVDRSRILLEEGSRNTRENATASERIAREHHFERLLLVTSAPHMQRAMDCFREVGLAVDPLPVDYRSFDPANAGESWLPRAGLLADSEHALRELSGRWIYRLIGYGKR